MPAVRHPLALPAVLLVLAALLKAPALGLPLYNLDDWGGVRDGIALLENGPGHLKQLLLGELGPRGARPLPTLFWAGAWKALGGWGGGYYAFDLLVHLLGAAALFALLRRLLGSTAAAAGTALWIFNGRLHQGAGYLGALDDDLAAAGTLLALALWPQARRGVAAAGLVGLIALLALASKPTAFVIGPLLVGLDALERADFSPRALLRRYAPVALAYALYLLHLRGLLSFPGTSGGLHTGLVSGLGGLLWGAVVTPMSSRAPGFEPRLLEAAAWGALLVAAFAGRRRIDGRALALGVGWTLLASLPALVFLVSGDQGRLEPRHAQPSALGLALVIAALVRPDGRRGQIAVAAWAGLLALGYAVFETPVLLRSDRSSAPALVDALKEEVRDGPPGAIHVGLSRLDHGLQGMFDLPGPDRLLPQLDALPQLFLLGGDRETADGPWLAPTEDFRLGARGPEGMLLVEELPAPGAERLRFRRVDLPLPPMRFGVAPPLRWTFPADQEGWAVGPVRLVADSEPLPDSTAPRASDEGLLVPSPRDPHGGAYGLLHGLTLPPYSVGQALLSPEVDLAPTAYCEVVIERTMRFAPDRRPPPDGLELALRPGGCGAAMLWTPGSTFGTEASGVIHLQGCTGRGRERLVGRLDNSPAWRSAEAVQRLALVPARRAGEATIHAIELKPCL